MSDFNDLNDDEKLKAENDFLKLKMMLERGTEFEQTDSNDPLPADIENKFLKNILEFEKQFEQHKVTTIYDKLGRPTHFKPVAEIPDDEIEQAWNELHNFMMEHGIELSAISPKVTAKELYRFTVEELFEHETDDIDIEAMISGFIYDEFYPDYEYENTNHAIDDCIKLIFSKEPLTQLSYYRKKIKLNNHEALSEETFKALVNQFKAAFDDIVLNDVLADSCTIEETTCTVKGRYDASAFLGNEKLEWKNSWTVIFHFDDEIGYWLMDAVIINGIAF